MQNKLHEGQVKDWKRLQRHPFHTYNDYLQAKTERYGTAITKAEDSCRRAKQDAVKGNYLDDLTEVQERQILAKYQQASAWNRIAGPNAFQVDHIKPVTKGGLHHPLNLQVVPTYWNQSKCNRNDNRWSVKL